ncbi:MAG: hypothetical protein Q4B60_03425 [Erysipelotrichaceae bacterium]|nr:hypothetical protein [Erysipelotrichaceae bacterium]
MDVKAMRDMLGDTQMEFSKRYNIPFRTIQNWELGSRKPPEYVIELLKQRIENDMINKKSKALPDYSEKKINLPKRSDYIGTSSWLKSLKEQMGEEVVFALDEALMCQELFGGRNDEFLIWVYGSDNLKRFNGIVVLGNEISSYDVRCKNGIKYTSFNRTIIDSIANENLLDMQGITEALSKYYYSNNNSFEGIYIPPEYSKRFAELADDAINYYKH